MAEDTEQATDATQDTQPTAGSDDTDRSPPDSRDAGGRSANGKRILILALVLIGLAVAAPYGLEPLAILSDSRIDR